MKYCPQCNRQYTEPWITFCSDDGSMLIEELAPPVDPNWNPVIREPTYKPPPSEEQTQWLPRESPMEGGGWVAPDERPPMRPPMWQPPPPQPAWRPPPPPGNVKQQSQALAIASMLTGLFGLVLGCLGPLPGIAAVVLGWMALNQIKQSPQTVGGKPMAIIGIVSGALTIFFYGILLLWMFIAGVLGNL